MYTKLKSKIVNKKIKQDLKKIVKIILLEEPEKISSVYLGGSFGRGEGLVKIKNKKIEIVNDYDLYLFLKKKIEVKTKKRIEKRIKKEVKTKVDIQSIMVGGMKRLKAHQYIYDLKYGSICLFGNEELDKIPDYKKEDIPLDSAEKLLLTRLWCLFQDPHEEYGFQQMVKAILAIEEAELIWRGEYEVSYSKKLEKIKKYEKWAMFDFATKVKVGLSNGNWLSVKDKKEVTKKFLGVMLKVGKKLNRFSEPNDYYFKYLIKNLGYFIYRVLKDKNLKYFKEMRIKFGEFYYLMYEETGDLEYLKKSRRVFKGKEDNLRREILEAHEKFIGK